MALDNDTGLYTDLLVTIWSGTNVADPPGESHAPSVVVEALDVGANRSVSTKHVGETFL